MQAHLAQPASRRALGPPSTSQAAVNGSHLATAASRGRRLRRAAAVGGPRVTGAPQAAPRAPHTACRRRGGRRDIAGIPRAPRAPARAAPQAVDAPSEAPLRALAERVRADTPVLHQSVHGRPLVYLDNAATSQKPRPVIDSMTRYYETINSNVHRGVHTLSARATDEYEAARQKVARFVNAASDREIVFTRNASEAINLVAYSWGMANLKAGDEVGRALRTLRCAVCGRRAPLLPAAAAGWG